MLVVLLIASAAWLTFGALATVSIVGKKREPVTGGVAAFTIASAGGVVAVLISAALTIHAGA